MRVAPLLQPERCMNDLIDVLEILRSQHDEVDELMTKLESKKGDRAALFAELADKLAAHATVEEKIFYPAAMSTSTEDLLHESVEEHLAIKRVLADMLVLDPEIDESDFDAKLSVLKEEVSHHAREEEETNLFPKLKARWSDDERAALGSELLAMFEELMETEPRREVPRQTGEAATLPTL
jgi:hemerythrin superfamily protein